MLIILFFISPSIALHYPKRIISCTPALTEILFALKLDREIAGVTTNCNYPPAAIKKEKIGGFMVNLEKVASLNPDLVVMQSDAQKKEIDKLTAHHLPVWSRDLRTAKELFAAIDELGKVTGRTAEARAVLKGIYKEVARVRARVKGLGRARQKVVMIVGLNPLIVVGGGNFIDDCLGWAGADNIAGKSAAAYPQFSFEKLVKVDPDAIILPQGLIRQEELKNDSRWQKLKAVRGRRVFYIDADIISRPGPRISTAAGIIADYLYPPKW
ncbi:MAG: helical backbone metal receptor [Candidatus Margulisiibacteriota bacterium]